MVAEKDAGVPAVATTGVTEPTTVRSGNVGGVTVTTREGQLVDQMPSESFTRK